jgi:PDZ domain-containing secreted protein
MGTAWRLPLRPARRTVAEVNGEAATDPNQLLALTLTKRAGDTVTVTYERNGHSANTTITLGAQT